MILKVTFSQPTQDVPVNNQHQVNGFSHAVLGKDNEWHDKFSDYAISSLQGGKLNDDKKTLSFPDYPYLIASSDNEMFLAKWMMGAMSGEASMFGMKVQQVIPLDFNVNEYFDKIITISPILLKKNDRKITFEDPDWLNLLKENTRKKLEHKGISEDFDIEIIHPEKSKRKLVMVGDVFNVCSLVRLKVTGSKRVRKTIYNMGFGNSTGCGFGSIKLYE